MLQSFNTVRSDLVSHFAILSNDAGFSGRPQLLAPVRIATLVATIVCISMYGILAQSQIAPQPQHPSQETQSGSPTSASIFEAARKLLEEGKYDEALSQLQALAAQNPKLPGLSHQLGAAYYKKGDFLESYRLLETGDRGKSERQ